MAQGNPCHPVLACETVQGAAPEPRAESTGCLALRNDSLHDAVSVLLDLVERNSGLAGITGQDLVWEPRLLLIQVDG